MSRLSYLWITQSKNTWLSSKLQYVPHPTKNKPMVTPCSTTRTSSPASGGALPLPPPLATTRWQLLTRSASSSPLLLALTLTLIIVGFSSLSGAEARTFPGEVTKLLALKAELERRGLGYLLDTWICPPEGEGECDPCGPTAGRGDSWGAWHYIACRQVPPGERAAATSTRQRRRRLAGVDGEEIEEDSYGIIDAAYFASTPGDDVVDGGSESAGQRRLLSTAESEADAIADAEPPSNMLGLVTNIHLSDLAIEGTLESMEKVLCPFRHLRELDLDGGRLVGPIPDFIGACFPHLLELDLSHNQLSGSVPADIWRGMPDLEQVKLEDNRLTGTIPGELASLGNLRVLWLDKNDLVGSVPAAFGATNALGKILSLNVEDNPSLCGDIPRGLRVDWRWQLSNQNGTSRDWFGFCVKDPCGIFADGGTDVGKKPCAPAMTAAMTNDGSWDDSSIAINSGDGQLQQPPSCGKLWDQCGGTVAVTVAVWPEEGGYGVDANITEIIIDVPFDGLQCCRRGLACVEVERNDTEKTSFSQCVNDPNWILPELKTEVPPEILREYRELNDAVEDTSCADAWQQCGGTANYLGPQCCKGAAPCVRSSEFYSQCDPSTCAAAWQQCGGYRHEGPQCCREGLECVIHNGGYHQCVVAATLDESRFERDSKSSKLRPFEDDELPALRGNDEEEARPNAWETRGVGGRDKVNGDDQDDQDDEGACVPLWGQCDGFFFEPFLRGPERLPCCGSPGDTKFDDERNMSSTKCVMKNDWFSACEACVGTWEQCGGLDYAGGSCCRNAADACVKVDDFFWQCQPPP